MITRTLVTTCARRAVLRRPAASTRRRCIAALDAALGGGDAAAPERRWTGAGGELPVATTATLSDARGAAGAVVLARGFDDDDGT